MTEYIIVCRTDQIFLNTVNTLSRKTKARFYLDLDKKYIVFNEAAVSSKKLTADILKSLLITDKCFIRFRKAPSNFSSNIEYATSSNHEVLSKIEKTTRSDNYLVGIATNDYIINLIYEKNVLDEIKIVKLGLSDQENYSYHISEISDICGKNREIIDFILNNVL